MTIKPPPADTISTAFRLKRRVIAWLRECPNSSLFVNKLINDRICSQGYCNHVLQVFITHWNVYQKPNGPFEPLTFQEAADLTSKHISFRGFLDVLPLLIEDSCLCWGAERRGDQWVDLIHPGSKITIFKQHATWDEFGIARGSRHFD